MSMIDVSVVIPSYNHAAFVVEAVESALACRRVDLEIVVIDDGSTDDSRDRLELVAGDPRVRIEHQENRGAHAALNRGCELARGRLIFILNSDDAYHPDRIERLKARLDASPEAALAASHIEVVDGAGSTIGVKHAWKTLPPWKPPTAGPYLSGLGDPRLALLETNWLATTSNMAFPSSLIRDHGLRFAPLRYAHDWDFALAACRHGTIEVVEEPLVRYRVHGANTIDEGGADGRAAMHFEIMWVVARHAMALLRSAAADEAQLAHLRELLWKSAPRFDRDPVLDQLLLLRGAAATPPPEYDALVSGDHPFRSAFLDQVGQKSSQQ